MRKNLLESFDKIYILDLHGNAKKKETAPDGSVDQNVFDIMQGVSINIFVKTGQKMKNELGKIYHSELYGKRDIKYSLLINNSISKINWKQLENKKPYYFFVPKDFEAEKTYKNFVSVRDIFIYSGSALNSERNSICVHFNKKSSENVVSDFNNLTYDELQNKYSTRDSRDWKLEYAISDIKNNFNKFKHEKLSYKPFDTRWIYYTGKSRGYIGTPSIGSMQHMLESNLALVTSKQSQKDDFRHVYISQDLIDRSLIGNAGAFGVGYVFPLYLYPETNNNQQLTTNATERTPNLNAKIVTEIAKKLDLTFVSEKEPEGNVCMLNNEEVRPEFRLTFAPIDILDYIYAVLHSPTYREKYKEFLKIDFPRVPYPKNTTTFWKLVKLGGEIRQLHLLESPKVNDFITSYPIDGDNIVVKPRFVIARSGNDEAISCSKTTDCHTSLRSVRNDENKQMSETGKVYINEEQYFDHVPLVAWEFYIGGYQPAQKWLKDRKGRTLALDDVFHYQKMIVALSETDRIMKKIDNIEIE
jgi:predicted helicase